VSEPTRREFLLTSAAVAKGGWLALHLPALASLAACSREAAESGAPLETFTAAEARTMAAFARRIVPSDDELPGAEEAGAVHFADRALADHFPEWLAPVREGLARLDARSREAGRGAREFAELEPGAQDDLLRQEEETGFFTLARMLVVMGTFSHPDQGGNREGAGWRILRMEHLPQYVPPFGDYDAEEWRARAGEAP
jgi:gluconate 2-dehydrogenase gamma chain